jgi:hypothetical protein
MFREDKRNILLQKKALPKDRAFSLNFTVSAR